MGTFNPAFIFQGRGIRDGHAGRANPLYRNEQVAMQMLNDLSGNIIGEAAYEYRLLRDEKTAGLLH